MSLSKIFQKGRYWLILAFAMLSMACASGRAIVNIKCPGYPIMLEVEVKGGTVKGKDLDHAIENHQRLWQHIHVLEKLGCRAK